MATMTRIEKIATIIFPAICRDLEDFGFSSSNARTDMANAIKTFGAENGAEKGLEMAQAVVDRGNGLLIKLWSEQVQDALKRARVQLKLAIKNDVNPDVLAACGETLDDVEFSFAPSSESAKPADVIRGLKHSMEAVNKVGFALKGENDKIALLAAAAKAEETLREREQQRAELVKNLLTCIQG